MSSSSAAESSIGSVEASTAAVEQAGQNPAADDLPRRKRLTVLLRLHGEEGLGLDALVDRLTRDAQELADLRRAEDSALTRE